MDERAMARGLSRGSVRALELAVKRYTPYVGTVICRTLSGQVSREDMEEITADVFLSLWRHAEALREEEGLRAYIGAIARNAAVDFRRRQRPAGELPEAAADPRDGPEQQAVQREWSHRLWQAVEALGEPDTTLFVRYYYEEDKLKTVAKELGISPGAAKQRLHRGRKALKKALSEGGEL